MMLILLVFMLAGAGLYAVLLFQRQVHDVTYRASVLPVAETLNQNVARLQATYGELRGIRRTLTKFSSSDGGEFRRTLETGFAQILNDLKRNSGEYCKRLENRTEQTQVNEFFAKETAAMSAVLSAAQALEKVVREPNWSDSDAGLELTETYLNTLQEHTGALPVYLAAELNDYAETMQRQSSGLCLLMLIFVAVSAGMVLLFIRLSFRWIFEPLQRLVEGSRQVASGKYGYRIALKDKDEIGELAEAMNLMTEQFEEKVRQKSNELVRSERLASVGFLAAGIAHEINNPLMAISACAESLLRRMNTAMNSADDNVTKNTETADTGKELFRRYLTMIQDEAFRCKEITGMLLSIARNEPKTRTKTDLVPLINNMLDMMRQHNTFKWKNVEVQMPPSLDWTVNAQEIKQVILNLLTNAFQNTEEAGTVWVGLRLENGSAVLTIRDDGIGMEPDVLANIFEPFFTQRKEGRGTGLGLSITHRIIEEHRGRITAESAGLGKGATFTVVLPAE